MKVAALISYFNDIDMLALQFTSGQFDIYDRIYIYDGPFSYTKSIDFMNINPPKLSDSLIGQYILNDSRIVYEYQEWKDEKQKRIEAYNRVEEDIICLHDSDEFYKFDMEVLNNFLYSNKSVAAFLCQNLFLDGFYASNQLYATDDPLKLPQKNFAFKKSQISAEDHLNYLWLVGVNQNEPNWEKKYHESIAIGYHFTGMRSEAGQVQKYIFYGSLHHSNSEHQEFTSASRLSLAVSNGILNPDLALSIYLNSIPGFHRCPDPSNHLIVKKRIIVNELEPILQQVLKKITWDLKSDVKLFEDIPLYFIVRSRQQEITLKIHGNTILNYEQWNIEYNSEMVFYDLKNLSLIETKIPSTLKSRSIASLIKIQNKTEKQGVSDVKISFL